MSESPKPRHPGARLAIMLAVFVPVFVASTQLNQLAGGVPWLAVPVGVLLATACLWVYVALTRRLERRPVTELARSAARRGIPRGLALGSGLFVAVLLVIAALGGLDSIGWGSPGALVAGIGVMCAAAVGEELLFRGILFRLLEEWLGSRTALAISALLFGGLHLVNPHATLWGALAIAIEAGLMLAAAYTFTRSLWLTIGFHFAWNLTEGGVFGTAVSGSDAGTTGLLHTVLSGPTALTGGTFGPEASLVAIAVALVPTVLWLRAAARHGRLLPRRTAAATLAR